MKLILESQNVQDYLQEIPRIIDFHQPLVQEKIKSICSQTEKPFERAKLAFEMARDEIQHSFDLNSEKISISAEETLENKEGICFAKSHLLATLLRGMGIPAGFCYQRVLRKGSLDSGYALHGLNAVFLPEIGWLRLDPRGNKPGVDAQFSVEKEQLAYPIRTELGEIDYPQVFINPNDKVLDAMTNSENCKQLFFNRPEVLEFSF